MDFYLSDRQRAMRDRVKAFIDEKIRPRAGDYKAAAKAQDAAGNRWQPNPVIEELKPVAREAGLWNFFMPPHSGQEHVDDSFEFAGEQLSNLEYALCAEEMGRIYWASEVFNCSAPDTGNMEVLYRYGTREQKDRWLAPLMRGEIRSAFLMTEPDVASSDATNIQASIIKDGNEWVINGRKWWSSGAGDPRCKVAIVMGKTDPSAQRHVQQSQILMPRRHDDDRRDLWSVFNRTQENLIKGGLTGRSANGCRQSTRPVQGIDQNLRLNRALWLLADGMRQLKR